MDTLETRINEGFVRLAMAIIQKAYDDYDSLNKRGIDSQSTLHEGDYSKEEVREFFSSDFCKLLFSVTGESRTFNNSGEHI